MTFQREPTTIMNNISKFKKGFTLLEVLVYLALFALMFAVITQFAFIILDNDIRARKQNKIDQNIIFVTGHINDSFNNSLNISSINSVFENSDGELYLINTGILFHRYRIVDGRLNYSTDLITETPITSSELEITNFFIEEIYNTENDLAGVRIIFQVTDISEQEITKSVNLSFSLP